MDESEVTQLNYQILTGKAPFSFPLGPNYPVENVSFYDAVLYANKRSEIEGRQKVYSYSSPVWSSDGTYCVGLNNLAIDPKKNGYRLPTLDEWKYAYLEQSTGNYYWDYTTDYNIHSNYAWFNFNAGGSSRPTKVKIPNKWNLFDMGGNVMELTEWGGVSYPHTVPMGGSWYDGAAYLSSENFFTEGKSKRCAHTGFRLVRKAPDIGPALMLLRD